MQELEIENLELTVLITAFNKFTTVALFRQNSCLERLRRVKNMSYSSTCCIIIKAFTITYIALHIQI